MGRSTPYIHIILVTSSFIGSAICTRRTPYVDGEAASVVAEPPGDAVWSLIGSPAGRPTSRDITLIYRGGAPSQPQPPQLSLGSSSVGLIQPVPPSTLETSAKAAPSQPPVPFTPAPKQLPASQQQVPNRSPISNEAAQRVSSSTPPVGAPSTSTKPKQASSGVGARAKAPAPAATPVSVDRLEMSESLSQRAKGQPKTAQEAKFLSFAATKDPPPKAAPAAKDAPAAPAKNDPPHGTCRGSSCR
eukprot:jgi/Botrbrau1/1275/Bobra.0163s0058.1